MSKQPTRAFQKLIHSDAMEAIRNLSVPVEGIAETLLEHWAFDLYSRKPGPAWVDEGGQIKPTDLDLVCFLSALADRNAVINLPTYTSKRAKTIREGETVLSKTNRHGRVIGLTANKSVLSFSIRVEDMNVLQSDGQGKEELGAPRNFMIVDLDGEFYSGWKRIEFVPTAKENDFLNDKQLWTGNTIHFENFVHPLRWTSFYGQYYFVTKSLIDRLEQDLAHCNSCIKDMLAKGVYFPSTGEGSKKEWPATTKGDSKPIKVKTLEVEVDIPWVGEHPAELVSQESLVRLDKLAHNIKFKQLPALRFATRATELAFLNAGGLSAGFPAWIKGASWEVGYVQPGKRTEWNRLMLTQRFPFEKGFAIRMREYEKSEMDAL